MAYKISFSPMLGFLGVGFILNAYGYESTHKLREIADLGVTISDQSYRLGRNLNLS